MVQPKVPWYEATIAYLILLPGILTWFLGIPLALLYSECVPDAVQCAASDGLVSTTGSYTGIFVFTIAIYVVAVASAVAVQLTVRKLHFSIVWGIAGVSLIASILAYSIMSGAIGTPWGTLVQPGAVVS